MNDRCNIKDAAEWWLNKLNSGESVDYKKWTHEFKEDMAKIKPLSKTLYKNKKDYYASLLLSEECYPQEIKYHITGNELSENDKKLLLDKGYYGGFTVNEMLDWLPEYIHGIVDPAPQRLSFNLCYVKGYFGNGHMLAYMDPPFQDCESCVYWKQTKENVAYFMSNSFIEVVYNMVVWYLDNCYNNKNYFHFIENDYKVGNRTWIKDIYDHFKNFTKNQN